MTLLIDNYDSFTYNLYDYICQVGEEVILIKNDEKTLAEIEQIYFDNIILSPGPKRPADAGVMNEVLVRYFDSKPILGICLGHQAIGEFFGATLIKAKVPMHGITSEITHTDHPIFNTLPKCFSVMRYHSLVLENVPNELEIIASTNDDVVMAIAHKNHHLTGLQFHPESILTEYGLDMIRNWYRSLI
jgi:anthranilate synthase component II